MSEFYEDEGLTMDQASPDLETDATQESTEGYEFDSPEAPAENKPETKRVSDRINSIRAEKDERIRNLEQQLADRDNALLQYRAAEEGITVEELAERDRIAEENRKAALHNDPEFLELQQRDFERQKEEVLTRLQNGFPDDKIESLDALPQSFFKCLQAGVDPTDAYFATVFSKQKAFHIRL